MMGKFEISGQEYFYRAKDDSGSSQIKIVKHEEHHYRMVQIINKDTQKSDTIMISTGDSFMLLPEMVKNQFEKYIYRKTI